MKKHTISLFFFTFFYYSISFAQLIINEVYADVAVSLIGDANGDGVRSARDDEFVELFNNDDLAMDISGYQIEVSGEIKHEFADETILPAKSFIVIFGGGMPTGSFGESLVVLASKRGLSLENSGTAVVLKNKEGFQLDSLVFPGTNIDASWTRTPDILGEIMPHNTVSDAFGEPFSPGTLINSFPFNDGQTTLVHFTKTKGIAIERDSSFDLFLNLINPRPVDVEVMIELTGGTGNAQDLGDFIPQIVPFPFNAISQRKLTIPITNDTLFEGNETFVFTITSINDPDSNQISINQSFELTIFDDDFDLGLELNEFLADPPTGELGDANQDGTRDAKQDEFLEFINVKDEPIDLSGMRIFDSEALRHQIPDRTIIAPNQLYLVFGGGVVDSIFGEALTQISSTKDLSLANSGDQIIIRDSLDNVVFFYEYGAEAGDNQSLVFCSSLEDVDGPTTLHTSIDDGVSFSPGFSSTCEPKNTTSLEAVVLSKIKLYPNPVSRQFYLDFPPAIILENASLVDISGKTIFSFSQSGSINLPNKVATGLYFVKMQTNKGLLTRKLIVW